jgi:hypothetical protein
LCFRCNRQVCRGRTVDHYFRCYARCGNEGKTESIDLDERGLRPMLMRGRNVF